MLARTFYFILFCWAACYQDGKLATQTEIIGSHTFDECHSLRVLESVQKAYFQNQTLVIALPFLSISPL